MMCKCECHNHGTPEFRKYCCMDCGVDAAVERFRKARDKK